MSSIYNKTFFNEFYEENGGGNYMNREQWMPFFRKVAQKIVDTYGPETVLDAGCARGYLVECLHELGVDAYGFDLSDYAIENVAENIKDKCFVHSITEPLPEKYPQRYDLVITIEVLEHLYPADGERAIANLCSYADKVIFSSTPDDIEDRTHVNVQLGEYWAEVFYKNSFKRDLYNDVTFISPWCVAFEKYSDIDHLVFEYEMYMRIQDTQRNLEIERERTKKDTVLSKIYYDMGDGYSEGNSYEYSRLGSNVTIKLNMPAGVKSVRFDPLEGQGCIVQKLEIFDGTRLVTKWEHNGFVIDDVVIFDTVDSQILVNDMVTSEIEISCTVYPIIKQIGAQYKKLQDDIVLKQAKNCELEQEKEELEQKNVQLEQEKAQVEQTLVRVEDSLSEIQSAYLGLSNAYNETINSFFWRLTKPFRKVMDKLTKITCFALFIKGIKSLKKNGIKLTIKKIKNRNVVHEKLKSVEIKSTITDEERKEQENAIFQNNVTFSIVVPLYNTPEVLLREMIESVQSQTYSNWELCMADGSDSTNKLVGEICTQYANADSRIKYKKLDENLGISDNTNACLDMATGNYIGLFDHDDLLHPSVLYYYMKEICDEGADFIYCDEMTFEGDISNVKVVNYKSDFAIDTLRANNYICHFTVFSKELLDKVGQFNSKFDGSQDYDMILRLTEKAECIKHVPLVLYFWRSHKESVASNISAKMYTIDAAKEALAEHYKRCGLECEIENAKVLSWYRTKYRIMGSPLVSILIPNKDSKVILKQCIDSIIMKSTYRNYEIVVVENNSTESETHEYYKELEEQENIKVVTWTEGFNYSKINNFGFQYCSGEYVVLLNNDIEVITPEWIEEMLMFTQRDDVGAAGAMLYYPNDTIQHAGVILGIGGVAGHSHKHFPRGDYGYMGRLQIAQNLSAVTAACMMVKRSVFEELNGFDEKFAVAFNDVDFCMRIREAGHLICWTPYAELYHHESISRGYEDTPEKQARFKSEIDRFHEKWGDLQEAGDPYYNPNLTMDHEDFRF